MNKTKLRIQTCEIDKMIKTTLKLYSIAVIIFFFVKTTKQNVFF
jgi:hypothetical protein